MTPISIKIPGKFIHFVYHRRQEVKEQGIDKIFLITKSNIFFFTLNPINYESLFFIFNLKNWKDTKIL